MRRVILLFSVFLSLSVSGQTYQELSEYALNLMEQDSLMKAEEVFREAMRLEPSNPHNALLFSNIGNIQRRMNKYNEAVESFTYAHNLAPRVVSILLNRGATYLELGLTDSAYLDYCQVLDLQKGNKEARLMRAYIYTMRRDYKAARLDYNVLLAGDPLNYSGRLGLIALNQKEKKYKEAIEALNLMITEIPDDETLFLMRAGIEMEIGQYETALIDLESALKVNPDNPEVYVHRGELYLLQNKKSLAKLDFEKAISLGIPASELRELLQQGR